MKTISLAPLLRRLEGWWAGKRNGFYSAIVIPMALLAVLKLGDEFIRLLFEFHETSANDLKNTMIFTREWFAGIPVYEVYKFATYPPASHLIFFPIFGQYSLASTRIIWAVINAGLLLWITSYSVRTTAATYQPKSIRWFMALVPLSMNAMGVVIGNGQFTLAVIVLLIVSLRLSNELPYRVRDQFAAGCLFFLALAKPSLTVPFFWIILFSSSRFLSPLIALFLYGSATLFTAQFQEVSFNELVANWLKSALQIDVGYANLHILLQSIDMKAFLIPMQLAVLLLLGLWVYTNRQSPVMLQMAVVALVVRFWTYHAVYDDVIILFPILVFFRFAQLKRDQIRHAFLLEWLAVANVLALLLPARMRYWPQPFEFLFKGGHALIWVADLIVLIYLSRRLVGSTNKKTGNRPHK